MHASVSTKTTSLPPVCVFVTSLLLSVTMPVFNLSFDTASEAGLTDLNAFLASRSYLVGYVPAPCVMALARATHVSPLHATLVCLASYLYVTLAATLRPRPTLLS